MIRNLGKFRELRNEKEKKISRHSFNHSGTQSQISGKGKVQFYLQRIWTYKNECKKGIEHN